MFFYQMVEKTRYRQFLYFLHRRKIHGIMPTGKSCSIDDPTFDITKGDVVHPCVRYFDEPFEGHRWWMVYTPLYGGNDSLENPRLCYADAKQGEAPTTWHYYCTIKERPISGYNSDPTLHYEDNRLFVFWRECNTPSTKSLGCKYATWGCFVKNKIVTYLPTAYLVEDNNNYKANGDFDRELSPTMIYKDGSYYAYAIHATITPKFIFHLPNIITSFIYHHNLFAIIKALGIYNEKKSHGIAIWKGSNIEAGNFKYKKTTNFKLSNRLYQPWHMDLFKTQTTIDSPLYAVVQTNVEFADICLAHCENGEDFSFYSKPLLTSDSIGMSGLYKPTALVVNNIFYLYYTVRDKKDNCLNKLFLTSMSWQELLEKLKS